MTAASRRGMIRLLATVVGAFVPRVAAQEELRPSNGTTNRIGITKIPAHFSLYLGEDYPRVDGLTVDYNGQTITLSAREIWDALNEGKQ